jgi:O-antigen ligase
VLDRIKFINRQAGTSFNENAFGAWITVAALIALCALQGSRARLIALIPMAVGAYLSGSRGALLAGLLGVLTVIFARSRFAKLLGPMLLIGCFVAIEAQVHLIPGLFTQTPTSISPSFRALNLNDPDTLQMRVNLWQSAVTKILSQPVLGPVDPRDLSKPYLVGQPVSQWTHAHDLWLQMLIEGGLLQLALLVTLVLFAVWRLARSQNTIWLAPLVAILLINIADFIFYYAPIRLAFGLLLGVRTMGNVKPVPKN